uniref:Uncharacterized protein n=1 Tax=Mycetohabitans sp. TaxID=2571162 RepID=A0A6B9HDB5_9BURK|nr:hypothetical protein [Mycetohabitans sp.]
MFIAPISGRKSRAIIVGIRCMVAASRFCDIEQRGGVHVLHIERDCGVVKMAMC